MKALHQEKGRKAKTGKISVEQILGTAVTIFMKKGYLGTSVREIADRMGVKAGSLYYHIQSKEEILIRIHDVLIDHLLEESEKIVANDTIDARKKFELFATELLRVMGELRPYAVVFFRDYRFLPASEFKKINRKRKRYQELLHKIIKQGIKEGEFRKVDTKIIRLGVFGMFLWAHTWLEPKGRLEIKKIAEAFSDVVLNGIGAGNR